MLKSNNSVRKLLGLMSIVFFMFTGCSEHKEYKVGLVLYHTFSWREKLVKEMSYAACQYDNVTIDVRSADNDAKRQVQQIRELVDEKVDILVISPIAVPAVAIEIERAYDSGIPIVLVDNKSITDKYTAFLGADNVKIGEEIGQYVGKLLGGKGFIAEIMGKKEDIPTQERHKGFMRSLQRYENIKLIRSEYGNWMHTTTSRVMEQMLENNPNIDLVFLHSDGMLSWQTAHKARQLNPNIQLVAIDALSQNPSGIELVKNGILTASFIYPTRGDKVMALVMKILQGKPYDTEEYLPTGLVDRSNMESIMQQHIEIDGLDSQIEHMQNKLTTTRTQYEQQRLIIILMIALIVVLILLCVSIFKALKRNRKLKIQQEQQIAKKEEQTKLLIASNEKLQVLNQQIEEDAQLKMNFFTNVSHEIRTPLTLIAGPIEELRKTQSLTASRKEQLLDVADRNIRQLLDMVNDILDYRKVQDGMMELKTEHFNLSNALQDWAYNFTNLAKTKGINLIVDCRENEGIWVEADRKKITSVVVNLLGNAFKHTNEGDTITITLTSDKQQAHISVKDTGEGIVPESLPRIFDTFYQSPEAQSGTGLGLALTKSLVELHKGSITVDSRLGNGTTFSVSIPLHQRDSAISTTDNHTEETTEDNIDDIIKKHKQRVLMIDDKQEMCDFVKIVLGDEYIIQSAENGLEGYKKAQTFMPDVIICDVMMPVMDGLTCCRKLKTTLATSHIPVLMLTARSLDENYIEGFDNGADAYITKPFSAQLLTSRIENLLKNRQMLRSLFGKDEVPEDVFKPRESEFVHRFREYIRQNLGNSDLNIEAISQHMNLSRAQFYAKIKSLTGISPIEHLRMARLEKVCHLIDTTEMNISEIAYACGFSAPSYLSKCFKDQYNMSPNEYRMKK